VFAVLRLVMADGHSVEIPFQYDTMGMFLSDSLDQYRTALDSANQHRCAHALCVSASYVRMEAHDTPFQGGVYYVDSLRPLSGASRPM
jgi:hypothetical protein